MNVGELKKILEQYDDNMDIKMYDFEQEVCIDIEEFEVHKIIDNDKLSNKLSHINNTISILHSSNIFHNDQSLENIKRELKERSIECLLIT